MRLETHEGLFADPASQEDITRAVAGLVDPTEAFIILGERADDEIYVQAAGTVVENFFVERRDGCAGEHYRGNRRVTADELRGMLTGYLRGDATWSHAVEWHRVKVDFGEHNAR